MLVLLLLPLVALFPTPGLIRFSLCLCKPSLSSCAFSAFISAFLFFSPTVVLLPRFTGVVILSASSRASRCWTEME